MTIDQAPATAVHTDTLIVGAGMAGLYCAWRLAQAGRDVQIVERLDRIGGRLCTDHVLIDGHMLHAEEGGMRFMTSQRELMALLHALDLDEEITPFSMGDSNNLYYLRGRRFTVGEAKVQPDIWSGLYHLDKGSTGKQPGQVLWNLRNALLRENGKDPATWQSTPENWTDFRLRYTHKSIALYRWGFWALLDDFGLSQDCVEMLYSASGFIAPYDQQINAGSAFQLLADFINPDFRRLRSGYGTLPKTLASRLDALAVPVHLSHLVTGVDRHDEARFRVTVNTPAGTSTFLCRHLVLALTQVALQQLAIYSPVLRDDDGCMHAMNTVADMPLGKINLYYKENWWAPRLGIKNGPCFTDLPLAQVYFFDDTPDLPGAPSHLTLYTDYYRSNFWAELQDMGEPENREAFVANPPYSVPASRFVVEAATRQMQEMFGIDGLPAPVLSTYKLWIDPRMGDGDHQWLVGVHDAQVRERLARPVPRVYICGESYSDDQAWVNGALRSVDYLLAGHFNIPALSAADRTTN